MKLTIYCLVVATLVQSVGATPDVHFLTSSSWAQPYADQWALQRVNYKPDVSIGTPVIVAVVDTGLDFFHPDLTRDRVWRNEKDPVNGIDDDNNGFVDDGYGWDFVNNDNNPSDDSGHGTHVAGVIAANSNNGIGISGINPAARIMVLKAMDFNGYGRASTIAQAIMYAADQGARVINISLGGLGRSTIEDDAIAYAVAKNVVVVAAAGNLQEDLSRVGIAGAQGTITVGASGLKDERLAFSNYGTQLDLLAPGFDVLSLRARRTDFAWMTGAEGYTPGSGYVGELSAYYRATGTSFAAPFVAGAASLILAQNPDLEAADVKRMLLHSARDTEAIGIDSVSGFGVLDIANAITADPAFYVDAHIDAVMPGTDKGKPVAVVTGTAQANRFSSAQVYIGKGETPEKWQTPCAKTKQAVQAETLCHIPVARLQEAKIWTIRLQVTHKNGRIRENRFLLTMG